MQWTQPGLQDAGCKRVLLVLRCVTQPACEPPGQPPRPTHHRAPRPNTTLLTPRLCRSGNPRIVAALLQALYDPDPAFNVMAGCTVSQEPAQPGKQGTRLDLRTLTLG